MMLVPFDRNGQPLRWPLVVYFCLDDYASDRNPNMAVRALVEKLYPHAMVWCGAVVILKAVDKNVEDFRYVDESDLDDVCSFFGQL